MDIQKDITLRAAYDKGRNARVRGEIYNKGRTQGRNDAAYELKQHLTGKKHFSWVKKILNDFAKLNVREKS